LLSKSLKATKQQNYQDLYDELHLLQYAQFFAKFFTHRAQSFDAEIPCNYHFFPRYLLSNLFIGSVTWNADRFLLGTILYGPTSSGDKPTGPALLFDMFLATPCLPTTPLYTEQKFSGSCMPGKNDDVLGQVMDAYAYHILVDSEGTILLSDLQGMLPVCQSRQY